ncbi:serotriflin-like [Anolis sagrei]|uniref:serotriflin-like n=1 Tax=Anolis sagrei TaxID=38937 RepID=UPI00352232A8
MLLQILLLPLVAMLQETLGQMNNGLVANISESQQKEIIDNHNNIRRNVYPTARNMMKMEWNTTISEHAKRSVEKCRGAVSPKEELLVDDIMCNQIVLQSKQANFWTDIVYMWNDTGVNFKYGISAIDPKHDISVYTQLVWHNSFQIGCAYAFCPNNEFNYFFLCNYCPAGNILKELLRPYEAGPPCGDCPDSCEDKLCISSCKYMDTVKRCDTLIKLFQGCSSEVVKHNCKATCNCRK